MGNKLPDACAYAKKYGKHDMERLGLFIEMPYLPARGFPAKPVKGKKKSAFDDAPLRSMLPGGRKIKSGNMDGYFDDQFRRLFQGEGPGRPPKGGNKKKEEFLPFMPAAPAKKHATPGDFFGCFGDPIPAFSPKLRPKPKSKSKTDSGPKPNCVTNPGKKGGPGYINITIGKYPEYKAGKLRKEIRPKPPLDGPMITVHYPRPFFYENVYRDPLKDPPSKRLYIKPKDTVKIDKKLAGRQTFMPNGPAKWEGGCKAGTFTKYPDWMKERWLSPFEKEKVLAGKQKEFIRGEFYPQSYGFKTKFTTPTLYKTDFSMNATNWKSYEPQYVKRLLKTVY